MKKKFPLGVLALVCALVVTLTSGVVWACVFHFHTVTFEDWDGAVLYEATVAREQAATAPEAPERTGYTFAGWDTPFDCITADTTVTALYEINRYDVTFEGHCLFRTG